MSTREPRPSVDTRWYEDALGGQLGRIRANERRLGEERLVFAATMERLAAVLDAVFEDGFLYGKADKAKFSIAHSAYALLWSSWIDALSGRLVSAHGHWRNIHESPDFLRAIDASPALGHEFYEGRIKLGTIRRALRRARKGSSRGDNLDWEEHRRSLDKLMAPLSHLTWESFVVTLPLDASGDDDGPVEYVREGANLHLLRSTCVFLAAEATLVYHSCVEVFGDRSAVARLSAANDEFMQDLGRRMRDAAEARPDSGLRDGTGTPNRTRR